VISDVVGIVDRTSVIITIRIKERVWVHSYRHLFYIAFGVPPKSQSCHFCSTDGDFSLYQQTSVFMWSRFHWQWQQCPTPELVNTTTSKVNKQLRRIFYKVSYSIKYKQKLIILMKIYSVKSLFLLALPLKSFFHRLAKTCQPCDQQSAD